MPRAISRDILSIIVFSECCWRHAMARKRVQMYLLGTKSPPPIMWNQFVPRVALTDRFVATRDNATPNNTELLNKIRQVQSFGYGFPASTGPVLLSS
jgi:hypothetical protein